MVEMASDRTMANDFMADLLFTALSPRLTNQTGNRRDADAVGKHGAGERTLVDSQMIAQQALEHGAQIGGGLEVAFLIELGLLQSRSAITRPPRSAPPARKATVPVPWSVPLVPLMRAVRPNSVMMATTVSRQASPMFGSIPASAPSRAPKRLASWPEAAPSLMWVSQPMKPTAPTRGPSGLARKRPAVPAASAK